MTQVIEGLGYASRSSADELSRLLTKSLEDYFPGRPKVLGETDVIAQALKRFESHDFVGYMPCPEMPHVPQLLAPLEYRERVEQAGVKQYQEHVVLTASRLIDAAKRPFWPSHYIYDPDGRGEPDDPIQPEDIIAVADHVRAEVMVQVREARAVIMMLVTALVIFFVCLVML